jgi:predicted RNA-binding protein YlxR (DUF448 family)
MLFDRAQSLSGRGVYVHSSLECFSKVTEVRLWFRSLQKKRGMVNQQTILAALDDARRELGIEFAGSAPSTDMGIAGQRRN